MIWLSVFSARFVMLVTMSVISAAKCFYLLCRDFNFFWSVWFGDLS